MNNPLFAYIKSGDQYYNLGDQASCPRLYFEEFAGCEEASIGSLPDDDRPLIVGGGGLFMAHTLNTIAEIASKRQVIIWGAGMNFNDGQLPDTEIKSVLAKCALVGIRDQRLAERWGVDYVPCASCMAPEFADFQAIEKAYPIACYRHSWNKTFLHEYPALENMDRKLAFTTVIEHISRHKIIVTNSYHGAYWTLLTGGTPILYQSNASRFATGLPQGIARFDNEYLLRYYLENAPMPEINDSTYRWKCRAMNQGFFLKAMAVLCK